jgi:hypothetical protein
MGKKFDSSQSVLSSWVLASHPRASDRAGGGGVVGVTFFFFIFPLSLPSPLAAVTSHHARTYTINHSFIHYPNYPTISLH